MTVSPREFTSEGHRLLLAAASTYSPAEIARLVGVRRQRVSDWRSGRMRPTPDDRSKLERQIGVPSRTWDMPPTIATPAAVEAVPLAPASSDDAEGDEDAVVPGVLGLDALAALAENQHSLANATIGETKRKAYADYGRTLVAHETLRQKMTTARDEYFTSSEFRRDVAQLAGAFPDRAEAFRERLARVGVDIPAIAPTTIATNVEAPTSLEDVEELIGELLVARDLRAKGERFLALAHTLGLALDVNTNAIAVILTAHVDVAPRFISLLEPIDADRIRAAISLRTLITAVKTAPSPENVSSLLLRIGREDLAREIGGVTDGQ